MIQINPLKSYIDGGVRAALTTPPSASLVFDLPGKAIWVKGVKLKGIDHTYTFNHDNYITLTNTPDKNNPESEDIKIGVNITTLKNVIDTTYNGGTLALLQEGLNTEERTWQAKILHNYINNVLPTTKNLKINGTNYAIYTTENSLPQFFAPVSLGTTGQILACTSSGLSWIDQIQNTDYRVSQSSATSNSDYRIILKQGADNNPETDFVRFSEYLTFNPYTKTLKINNIKVVTATDIYAGSTAGLVPAATSAQQNYYLRGDGAWVNIATEMAAANTWRPIKVGNTDALGSGTNTGTLSFIAGTGIALSWDATNKRIIITNSSPDVNHNTDENVRQVPKTDNVNRPLMMINGSTSAGEQINTSMFSTGIYANASTKMITANGFIKAGSSNNYILLGDGSHKAVSDFATSNHSHSYINKNFEGTGIINVPFTERRFEYGILTGDSSNPTDFKAFDNYCQVEYINLPWLDNNFGGQIMLGANSGKIGYRTRHSGTWNQIKEILHQLNYTNYTVKKDGTGASGTWNISITGNADTVDGYHATCGNNKPWGTIPVITTSGWMDVGKQFEFHYDNTTGSDYSTVLRCNGNYSNIVNLPSVSGTLALLTDNVASATKLQTSRKIWGNSFDGTNDIGGTILPSATHTYNLGSATYMFEKTYTRYINTDSGYDLRLCCSGSEVLRLGSTDKSVNINYDANISGKANIASGLKVYNSANHGCYVEITEFVGNPMNGGSINVIDTNGNASNRRPLILQYGQGNVGIGIATPDYKLHVAGDIYTTIGFKKEGSSDSYVLLGGGGHKALSDFSMSGHNHDGRYLRWNGSAADISAMGWGTLTAANGYTILSHAASSDGGDVGFVSKSGQIFMQLNGYYYQKEGRCRVLDTSDFTAFSNIGSQTTRITIGGVTKDLKIDADTLDSYNEASFFRSRAEATGSNLTTLWSSLGAKSYPSVGAPDGLTTRKKYYWGAVWSFPANAMRLELWANCYSTASNSTNYTKYGDGIYYRTGWSGPENKQSWLELLDSKNYKAYINSTNFPILGHSHSDYVTSLSISGDYLVWSKGDAVQTNLTIPYASKSKLLSAKSLITTTSTINNLNNIKAENSGIEIYTYKGNVDNAPTNITGDGELILINWQSGIRYNTQIAIGADKENIAFRWCNSADSWRSWKTLIHSGNYSSYCATTTQGTNADTAYGWGNHANAGYAKLSGATFTGNLYTNTYLGVNAWSGYGSGAASAWYNGNSAHLVWDKAQEAPAFYSSSDIRLKNNINNISKSIRSFNWKESGQKSYGLIAQEIENEYPELVSSNNNGYKSINYTSALCMLIAKLENGLDELKEKVKQLEDKLRKYENTL